MITKIILNKVACFKKPTILQTDKKVNLLYGLNGTGKSTLSNYLYNPTDTKFKDCTIEGLENTDILVYNQTFIQDNFFESENLKGIFTLSKTNKEAEEKIIKANLEIKQLEAEKQKNETDYQKANDDISERQANAKTKIWAVKTQYTGGDRVLEFCLEGYKSDGNKLLAFVESLKKPSLPPTKTIDNLKEEAQALSGGNAQKYSRLNPINFALHSIEDNTIFTKQIVGNENSSVGEFINKLGSSDWVKKGLEYLPSEIDNKVTCPFCQELTISKELFNSIKNYFDETYENDLTQVKSHLNNYTSAINSIPSKSQFESNPKYQSFKKDFETKYAELQIIFSDNKRKIEDKLKSPSQSLRLVRTEKVKEELNTIINDINKMVDEHNKKIDNKDKALTEIKKAFWEIIRWEYDQTISTLISDKNQSSIKISEIKKSIDEIDNKIKAQRKIIIDQQKNTVNIDEAIGNINNGLADLGIDEFKIIKHSEILYKISRTDIQPKIFHSLSEGEKMIISFLYFLELCKGKKSATDAGNKKIIVIDDPISSLSHIYIFNVGRLIHNEFLRTDKYEQVFVLTHSLYFFYELTDTNKERRKEKQKLFRLRKNSAGAEILEMSYEEIQNDYQSYWFIVKDEKQPPALIANCMRNIVEYFFSFVEKKDFSNVIQMPELQENRLQAFCRYINRESHSIGQNVFDLKEFDYEEFKDGFALVFKLSGYEDHYKKMMK